MKITQEEIVDRQTVLHVELEDDDLAPYIDRAFRRVVQRVSIPGFRKGKAPRHIVERFVGKETLVSDSLEDILPEATQRAISEQGLESAGTPRIELAEVDYGGRGELLLRHHFDGRELQLDQAGELLLQLSSLWGRAVHLVTREDDQGRRLTAEGGEVRMLEVPGAGGQAQSTGEGLRAS